MKNNGKRILAFALALLASAPAALSCGDNTGSPASTDAGNTQSEAVTEALTGRAAVSDNVPELNFEGADFRTLTQTSTINDFWVEGETGDILNDAMFNRNRRIEERFNIHFADVYGVDLGDVSKILKNCVTSGDDAYELVSGQMEQSGNDALGGYFMNWYDVPYMDFTAPWYPSNLVDVATVNGKMFIVASDMCMSYVDNTGCFYYDKVKAADYDIPDLYQMVDEGKWTIDQLFTLNRDIYEDLDGSNSVNDQDYFGMYAVLDGCTVSTYFYGLDQPYVSVKNGEINMDLNCDKMVSILDKLREGFFNTPGVWGTTSGLACLQAVDAFLGGHTLFTQALVGSARTRLRDSVHEYGILPYPKWDEAQDRYYSAIDAGASILTVPTTAGHTDMTGAVVHALSAESWKEVMPVYYDLVMDSKCANDEGSIRMLDVIFNSRIIDFAYLYDGWNGWIFKVQTLFTARNMEFSSFYAANEPSVRAHFENVLALFDAMDE